MTRIHRKCLLPACLLLVLTACGDGTSPAPAGDSGSASAAAGDKAPAPNPDLPPLKTEQTDQVETLPSEYPDSWFLAFDMAFMHMLDGKTIVLDARGESIAEQVKGTFNVSFGGNIARSAMRHELYAAETFYSRGVRGERTDVLTIYDTSTLAPKGEIVWPEPIRYNGMPQRYALTLVDNDRLLLAYDFDPSNAVTVFDLDKRKVLNKVGIPGCALVYPTGKRGFTSLCGDGGLVSTQLSADGEVRSQTRLDPFFDTDTSPLFERPAIIDGIAYFPTFKGKVQPIDLTGDVAKVGEPWNLVPESERDEHWRPGGIAVVDYDDQGRFYVLMHPDGHDGTHNEGGSEVWVFDPARKARVGRIKLANHGLSIAVGGGEEPLMMVTNGAMAFDVYEANSGRHLRTIDGAGQETPLMLYGIK